MIKTAKSGHTMDVSRTKESFSDMVYFKPENYTVKYIVRNWDENGCVFFYIARYKNGQYHVWYRKISSDGGGRPMWASFGKTIQEAIDGAQQDGWMYA